VSDHFPRLDLVQYMMRGVFIGGRALLNSPGQRDTERVGSIAITCI